MQALLTHKMKREIPLGYMTNPTPGTQLARVLNLMLDGEWRSPAEIAQATGDRVSSITSRIRDLRLAVYGGRHIESRKRDITQQVWEYRLVIPTAEVNHPGSLTTVGAVPARAVSQGMSPYSSGPPIKFLNMDTMQVEQISRDRCKTDSSHGFDRVVAVDARGSILSNLVTTQAAL